jgi:hypothetical protein
MKQRDTASAELVGYLMYYTGKEVAVSYKLSEMRKQKDLIMWWKK